VLDDFELLVFFAVVLDFVDAVSAFGFGVVFFVAVFVDAVSAFGLGVDFFAVVFLGADSSLSFAAVFVGAEAPVIDSISTRV
jgi:hypothetical protein